MVDGAAFGSEIEEVIRYLDNHHLNCAVYAPESFEYLLLKTGFVRVEKGVLEETWNYADSARYISWEAFFTDVLVRRSQGTVYQYKKHKLGNAWLNDTVAARVAKELPPQIQIDGKEAD